MPEEMTKTWQDYEKGIDYKTRIGLYAEVDRNERVYAGKQWEGIPSANMPKPVINICKTGVAWKVAAVADRRLSLKFSVNGKSEDADIKAYIKQVNEYVGAVWERLKMDYIKNDVLKSAAITGDGVLYFPWDPKIKTGQDVTGDISAQLVDNVNYYPGDVNTPDVQDQPYIILSFRTLVSKAKAEAKSNKVSAEQIQLITGDNDNDHTSGDMGKIELDDSSKCTVLLKFTKNDDGYVVMEKSTRAVEIMPKTTTKLTRYPIALMNWETRKNSCHGTAEITELIPNQVSINKIAALAIVCLMNMGFPKVVYDKNRTDGGEWQDELGVPIGINGDVSGAAQYLSPGTMSYDVKSWFKEVIDQTFDMMGANSAVRGNINDPDNTSALIAVRDMAMVPLAAQQDRFYSFDEDCGLIILDYIKGYYEGREIPIKAKIETMDATGQTVVQEVVTYVPMPDLSKYELSVKIDVGPSTTWSEIQSIQTLDALLKGGYLTPAQYYKRIEPFGYIPEVEELIEYWTKKQEMQEQVEQAQAMMAMQPQATA